MVVACKVVVDSTAVRVCCQRRREHQSLRGAGAFKPNQPEKKLALISFLQRTILYSSLPRRCDPIVP